MPRPERAGRLRRYRPELLWGLFAVADYAAMVLWPVWSTIPFHFVWISLVVVYGYRLWPWRWTLAVLALMSLATAATLWVSHAHEASLLGDLLKLPLLGAMFVAMVWHARRRVAALRLAEWRAEDRRSLLERQERFIHDASHELRTPLTIARGHLELLRGHLEDVQDGDITLDEVGIALDELGRMDAIIERLLLLAAAGQPEFVQVDAIDIEPFLEDVFMRWSELAPRAWRLGPLAIGTLRADPERLRAALDALLENAVKYTPDYAAIELRARATIDGRLRIEVRDEGYGIPDAARARIFERFARADAARTRSAGGVGLGLAIVDAIVKAHGGHCSVHSSARGSVFALALPHFAPAPSPVLMR